MNHMEIVRRGEEKNYNLNTLDVLDANSPELTYRVVANTRVNILTGVARVSLDNGRTYRFYGPTQGQKTFEVKAGLSYRMGPYGRSEVRYSVNSYPDDSDAVSQNRKIVRSFLFGR